MLFSLWGIPIVLFLACTRNSQSCHLVFRTKAGNDLRNSRDRFTDPRIGMTRSSGLSIEDVRLSDFKRPYLCAELSFCPDYCYGRNTQGIVKDIRRDNGNPCFGLPDSWCSVYPEKNGDFSHLMRNDFNYSCRCEGVHVGFTWNKKLGLCVDVDECEEGLHNCAENMICQNTVGSFQCFCTWGYHWTGQSCTEVTQLLKRSDVDTAVPFGNTGTQHKGRNCDCEQGLLE